MRIRDILKKPVSVALCAALLVGGSAGVTAYAVSAARQDAPLTGEAEQPAGSKQETTLTNSKDETVYVLTGADGSVQKIIVSDWVRTHWARDRCATSPGWTTSRTSRAMRATRRAATTPRCGMPQARTFTIRVTSTSSCPWD